MKEKETSMTTETGLSPMTPNEAQRLMRVALGREPADLAVLGATLLNVYTGELQDGVDVTTAGRFIASVGAAPKGAVDSGTTVIDAKGKTVIPGLIDGHTHLSFLCRPDSFLNQIMSSGTTGIVTETLEVYSVAGLSGVFDFLDAARDQPIKVFALAPSMVSISRSARGIESSDLGRLLDRPEVIGLGESYWQAVLQNPGVYLPAMMETRRRGFCLEGHSAGAKGDKLNAYAALGVTSCHEPITAEETLERLRLGIHVMAREGGIRRDLDAIAAVKDSGADLRRLILATDSIGPAELLEKGYMEYLVQKAVDLGFDPVAAVRCASLNVAEHFHIDHLVGGIAPGRFADMVVIPDPKHVRAEWVVSSGRVIAAAGKALACARDHRFSKASRNTVKLPRPMRPEDFRIPAEGKEGTAAVRVVEMITDLVTREEHVTVPVVGGEIAADSSRGLLKIAAVDRAAQPGRRFTGLIRGFGLRSGAIACSAAWDSSDIVVIGADDADLAFAVNRICQLRGGAVVCRDGQVLAELALPIFGLISELSMDGIVESLARIGEVCTGLGVSFRDPVLSLITLTGAAIPFFRICEEGLVTLRDGKTGGLFVEPSEV